jgi:hypothetical protein
VIEIKDDWEPGVFYWSRQRIIGLVFVALASPIFFGFASFGHKRLGIALWAAACLSLMTAYLLPTRFRKFMRRLIPTTAEKAARSRMNPDA